MPSRQRVSWAQLRVGIMAAVAMILVAVLVFLMTGEESFLARRAVIYTYMDDSAALVVGSAVRLNGILIGSIKSIGLSGENKPNRIIRIEMEVLADTLRQIPDNSRAAISAQNLLGTKFVNIKKGDSPKPVVPGGEIPSLDTLEFEELQQQIGTVMTSLQSLVKRVDAIVSQVEQGRGSIGKLLVSDELYKDVLDLVADFKKTSSTLAEGKGTVGKLLHDETLYSDLRRTMARLDRLAQDLHEGQGTAGKLLKDPALYDEARQTVASLKRTIDDLNAGKGSAGKFLKSDELHNQVSATIAKIDLMIDRLNSGQGTLGQLLVNPQLYESLNGAAREMQAFMKDFRANPKKFLRIKLAIF